MIEATLFGMRPCGKPAFTEKEEAKAAGLKTKTHRKAYRCKQCGEWHLDKKRRRLEKGIEK